MVIHILNCLFVYILLEFMNYCLLFVVYKNLNEANIIDHLIFHDYSCSLFIIICVAHIAHINL